MMSSFFLIKEAKRKQSYLSLFLILYYITLIVLLQVWSMNIATLFNLFILGPRRDKKCCGQVTSMILPVGIHDLV